MITPRSVIPAAILSGNTVFIDETISPMESLGDDKIDGLAIPLRPDLTSL